MKPLKIVVDCLLFVLIFLTSTILIAQENIPCEKLTDTLTGKLIFKNTEVKATPSIGQTQLSYNLDRILQIQSHEFDAQGMFDKTLIAGFFVTPKRKVIGERILKTSGFTRLDSLYLKGLRDSEWMPGKCQDKNVNTWVEFEVMIYKQR